MSIRTFQFVKKLIRSPSPLKRAFKEENFRLQITNAIPVEVWFTALTLGLQ
jgi:uncharacterized protein YqjF (DUF2071 family)